MGHPCAAALIEASLSMHTLLEVALLGTFTTLRFSGEAYATS